MNLLYSFDSLICQNTLSDFVQNDIKGFLVHLLCRCCDHGIINPSYSISMTNLHTPADGETSCSDPFLNIHSTVV